MPSTRMEADFLPWFVRLTGISFRTMETSSSGIEQQPTQASSSPQQASGFRHVLRFVLHVGAVYLSARAFTPWIVSLFCNHLAPAFHIIIAGGNLQFYFKHLFWLTVIPALLVGYMNSKYRHAAALWVWLVPAILLLAKLATFQSSSVLTGSGWREAFAYYFSSNWQIPTFPQDLRFNVAGMRVFLSQVDYSAPFYAGMAYSVAALAGKYRNRPEL